MWTEIKEILRECELSDVLAMCVGLPLCCLIAIFCLIAAWVVMM